MKKSNTPAILLALLLIPVAAAALAMQSCAGGETVGNGSGSGGTSGTGGRTGGGTGGLTNTGTGGLTNTGTGGLTNTGTGGLTNTGTGGQSTGTGGQVGGGTGGVVGGGTGGAVATGAGITITGGGFGTNGTWMGYGYTSTYGTTATISPVCPTPCFTTPPVTQFCAMGTVAADPSIATSGALLGWNVNQIASTMAGGTPVNTKAVTGTGLYLSVMGNTTGLRVQIQNGSPGPQWCALLIGTSPFMIPWTMFNTACYNTAAGTFYSPATPITAVGIVVPSAATTSTPFNVCLLDAHPY